MSRLPIISLLLHRFSGWFGWEKPQAKAASLVNTLEEKYQALIGREGISLTPLRRAGIIELDGVKYEAESASPGVIPARACVRIIGVVFKNRLKVVQL